MTSDITLYTAICGSYDKERSDITVFRDTTADKFVDPAMNAKVYKVLPHHFFESKFRIWMDGNIYPKKPPEALIQELLQDHDIAVFHHPWRKCIYDEYPAAKMRLKDTCKPLIDGQIKRYMNKGMPAGFGLAECGVILSRANDATREFFERWWAEICRHSSRDQVSFPYVWWKMSGRIRVRLIGKMRVVTPDNVNRFGEWFQYVTR